MLKFIKMKRENSRAGNEGFTLAEMMVATLIVIITIVGILVSYLKCLELTELSKNTSIALNAAKSRIEQIKNTQFNQILANYNNVAFTEAGFDGIGVSYVDNTNPDLLQVTVTFCWRQSNGRVVGEDTNLNGVLNAGEDTNTNGILDSRVQIVNYIFDKG